MGFENTQYARDLFQKQLPSLIREMKRIADNQEKLIELQLKAQENKAPGTTVYACYEENTDIGQTARLFVTVSREEAREWGQKALADAKKNDFYPFKDEDETQFFADFEQNKGTSIWVYKSKKEDARENYGICIDIMDVTQSSQQLRQLFE